MSFQNKYNAKGKPNKTKEKILNSIEKGIKQAIQIEKGKLKSTTLKQLLDAL
jgi:hypothetical protein